MKIEAKITISKPQCSSGERYISIAIEDDASHLRFFQGKMSLEDFADCLTGHSYCTIEGEVGGLSNVGKTKVMERRTLECPLSGYGKGEDETWLIANGQEEGWILDSYLGSQNSVSHKDGKKFLNYSVHKYV